MSYSYILMTRDQYPKVVGAWHQKYSMPGYVQQNPDKYFRAFRASGTSVEDISDKYKTPNIISIYKELKTDDVILDKITLESVKNEM